MSALSDVDRSRIAALTGLEAAGLEILGSAEETRLKFNSPTRVRYWVLRGGGLRLELFFWLEDDEWELVHVEPMPG